MMALDARNYKKLNVFGQVACDPEDTHRPCSHLVLISILGYRITSGQPTHITVYTCTHICISMDVITVASLLL